MKELYLVVVTAFFEVASTVAWLAVRKAAMLVPN